MSFLARDRLRRIGESQDEFLRDGFSISIGLNIILLVAAACYCQFFFASRDAWSDQEAIKLSRNLNAAMVTSEYRESLSECRLVASLLCPPNDINFTRAFTQDPALSDHDRLERLRNWMLNYMQMFIHCWRTVDWHEKRAWALREHLKLKLSTSPDVLRESSKLFMNTLAPPELYDNETQRLIEQQSAQINTAFDLVATAFTPVIQDGTRAAAPVARPSDKAP